MISACLSQFQAEPKNVVLVHGEAGKMDFLKQKIEKEFGKGTEVVFHGKWKHNVLNKTNRIELSLPRNCYLVYWSPRHERVWSARLLELFVHWSNKLHLLIVIKARGLNVAPIYCFVNQDMYSPFSKRCTCFLYKGMERETGYAERGREREAKRCEQNLS